MSRSRCSTFCISSPKRKDTTDMSSIPDDKVLMKEIRQHIHELALEYGRDGVSYILVKDKLIDKYVLCR